MIHFEHVPPENLPPDAMSHERFEAIRNRYTGMGPGALQTQEHQDIIALLMEASRWRYGLLRHVIPVGDFKDNVLITGVWRCQDCGTLVSRVHGIDCTRHCEEKPQQVPPPMPEGCFERDGQLRIVDDDDRGGDFLDVYINTKKTLSLWPGSGHHAVALNNAQALYLAHVLRVWAETGNVPEVKS